MSTLEEALAQALRRARAGNWHGAHEIVQQHEGDARADWIHAVLHRIEGDLGNARYWYRRCGQALPDVEPPQAELARIANAFRATQGAGDGETPRSPTGKKSKPRRKGRP